MAVATYDVGVYGTDTYYEEPPLRMSVREKPALRVKMDIQTPGGKHYRWAEDEPSPENVPSALRWSDTMPGGFETMDCVLPRKPGIDYADLEQLSTIRVLGASGDVAGEFRLERAPRTSGDQVSVSPGAVGWQAHLEDDKSAVEIYLDRDISHWAGPSRTRRVALYGVPAVPMDASAMSDATVGLPALAIEWQDQPAVRWIGEGLYDAGAGNKVAQVYYDISRDNTTEIYFYVGDDDNNVTQQSANLTAGGSGVYTPAVPRRYAFFQAERGASAANSMYAHLRGPVVIGDHGLTLVNVTGGADGFYASDVVSNVVPRWAPQLSITTESVQASSFVIPHFAFLEPTTAGEIVRQATRFGLQDWGVWDNKTFWWHERGTFSKRWRSRVSPAQLDETGPQVDRLWESIIVQYQDVDGTTRTVGPPGSGANIEDAVLKDSDPDNPANLLGIVRRDVLQMGTSTAAGATEVGRRFLEQAKVLDRSGRARLVGHVEDDRGVVHPYWRPRAGDYIEFLDAADPSPRRIVKTDKDHSARTCGLDLDAPPEGLQALLERLGVVLVPLGVG